MTAAIARPSRCSLSAPAAAAQVGAATPGGASFDGLVAEVAPDAAKASITIEVVDPTSATAAQEQAARNSMQQFINDTIDEYTIVTPVIRSGVPADEIAQYAREEQIDLIVMATHGRTGLAHALIGSIAEKVVRCSTVPVFVVKPTAVIEKLITEDDVAHDLHLSDTK